MLLAVLLVITSSIVVYSADAAGIPKKAISTVARFLESDLPTTTVFTDVANTFGAGQKQTFTSSSTTAGLNIASSGSDPSSPADGDVWLNGATLKYRGSGATNSLLTSAITSINSDVTAAQTIAGTSGNVTITNAGATHTINLGSNAVVNNLANTYTAGAKQTFQSSSTTAGVNLAGVSSNPSSLSTGDLWRNTSIDSLMLRGSSTYTILSNHTFAQLYNPSNLVHAKSASITMLGLGGSSSTSPLSFTPTTTGRVLITFSSTILTAVSAKPYTMQFSYGTGTAPTTGAAATGTTVGPAMIFYTPANNISTYGPMVSSSVLITGLNPGTTYWADLRVNDANASPITFGNILVNINEI